MIRKAAALLAFFVSLLAGGVGSASADPDINCGVEDCGSWSHGGWYGPPGWIYGGLYGPGWYGGHYWRGGPWYGYW